MTGFSGRSAATPTSCTTGRRRTASAEARAAARLRKEIVETALGPVLHRWLLGLEQYVAHFDDRATAFLYCARAGVRIRRLFDRHCAGRGVDLGPRHAMLWSSRLALCKALFHSAPDRAAELIAREYRVHPLRDIVSALLRNAPETLATLDVNAADLGATGDAFPGWIRGDAPAARALRASFAGSGTAFAAEWAALVGDAERVVLVDSGWQGSAQGLLARAHPGLDVHGLYLGRILGDGHDPEITDRAVGLLFEAECYDPERPESALMLHRHLFESLLEPNGPSIEEVRGGPQDAIACAQIRANADEAVSRSRDALFLGVETYLAARAGAQPADIEAAAQVALPRLARMLAHPTPQEARALAGKDRSADFGKGLVVPVLLEPHAAPDGSGANTSGGSRRGDAPGDATAATAAADAETRIARSLWPQGQAALEHDGRLRRDVQRQLAGLGAGAALFDPCAATPARAATRDALVSVVTRTRNRPVLLRRAAASVAGQTHPAIEWIVVNDGGDEAVVREVVEGCAVDRRAIRLVSTDESRGMEAASNRGIALARGRYLLVHDDDDTLHPDFLQATVGFLESPEGRRYGGVVTGADYVSEEIRGNRVTERERVPYMDWVTNIQLAELLAQNLFPPIAFLYRRALYDEIGGYNEDLPVLGDWYFNLEFLLRADIAVLPRRLAGYHHRDCGEAAGGAHYANSVIGGVGKHREFAAVMRNMFMRRHGRTDPVAASAIAAYFAGDVRARLDRIEARLAESGSAAQPRKAANAHLAEIDRLWALAGLFAHAATASSPAGAPVLGASAGLGEISVLLRDTGVALAPHPTFDEGAYLARYPDVAEAVAEGRFASGYEHFLHHGRDEGRARPGA